MKVLVSAYACEPHKGSEPQIGWTWSHAIARVMNEVHVITRANNRGPVEEALARDPVPNLHFHYFDLPAWARFWKKGQRGVQLYYILWQYALPRFARSLHAEHDFDVAHHVSMTGQHYPPGLAALSIPFIWGPIGGLRVPPSLRASLHGKARLREIAHDGVIRLAKWDPMIRRAFRTARMLVSYPGRMDLRETTGEVLTTGCIFPNLKEIPPPKHLNAPASGPLHLVSAFRMIFWKGGDLGAEAVARLRDRGIDVRWTVLGDGPERKRWEKRARHLQVRDRVDFRGWVSRSEVIRTLRQGDVLLHPAYREGWGGAVLEGMALGLPVVCLDWGGPSFIVDDDCGVAVSVDDSRDRIIEGLADGIERLTDPETRSRMGAAARRRVDERFSLEALDSVVREVYARVLA